MTAPARAGGSAHEDRTIARLDRAITVLLSVFAATIVFPEIEIPDGPSPSLDGLRVLAATLAFAAWVWREIRLRRLARQGFARPHSNRSSRAICALLLVFLGLAFLAVLRRCLLPEGGGPADFELPDSAAELWRRFHRGLREYKPLLRVGAVFLAGSAVLRAEQRWRPVLASLSVGFIVVSVLGLVWYYVLRIGTERAYALPGDDPGLAGMYLAAGLLLVTGGIGLRGWPRWTSAAAAALALVQVPLTGSRTALLGLVAALGGLLLAALFLRPRGARPRRALLLTAGAGALVLAMGVGLALLASKRHRRHLPSAKSVCERFFIWDSTLLMIGENPWTGYGLDRDYYRRIFGRYAEATWGPSLVKRAPARLLFGKRFTRSYAQNWEPYARTLAVIQGRPEEDYERYRPAALPKTGGPSLANNYHHAHNVYLMTWVEMGLVGLLALLALWGYGLVACARALRRERDPVRWAVLASAALSLLAVAVMGLTDPSLKRQIWRVASLAWALAAGALARAAPRGDNPGAPDEEEGDGREAARPPEEA